MTVHCNITGPYIKPACLPGAHDNFDNIVCTATGWGATYEGNLSDFSCSLSSFTVLKMVFFSLTFALHSVLYN